MHCELPLKRSEASEETLKFAVAGIGAPTATIRQTDECCYHGFQTYSFELQSPLVRCWNIDVALVQSFTVRALDIHLWAVGHN
jgi:hypothetical protein